MDNMISLKEYLNNYSSNEDKRKAFYFIDKQLKENHSNGLYISKYSVDSILIKSDEPSVVKFDNIIKDDSINNGERKNLDLLFMSMIAFSSYLPNHSVSDHLLNYGVVKENFDSFSYIFKDQDVEYYKDVLVNDNYTYYSDYINDLNNKLHNGSMSSSRVLSYSTPEGRAISEKEGGYANTVLFIANILSICVIGALMCFYLFK